jgi:predicted GH43/DUF377 family glycosyl hydrolase
MKSEYSDPFRCPTFAEQLAKFGGESRTLGKQDPRMQEYFTATSIIKLNNEILVAQRLLHLNTGSVTFNWRRNFSSIVLSRLQDDYSLKRIMTLSPSEFAGLDSLEDPRLNVKDSKLEIWFAACNFSQTETSIRQMVVQLESDYSVSNFFYPDFGRNMSNGYEKNWCPIPNTNQFVYKCGGEFTVVDKVNAKSWTSQGLSWNYGEIHCGSSPILVEDNYFMFFHSSLDLGFELREKSLSPRHYFVGALTFSSRAPYQLISFTENPLFVGSFKNTSVNGSPAAVFVTGSVLLDSKSLMFSLNLNDCESVLAEVPIGSLFKNLTPFKNF